MIIRSIKLKRMNIVKSLEVGSDSYFYARKEEGLLSTILVPISDEEAGVLDIHKSI